MFTHKILNSWSPAGIEAAMSVSLFAPQPDQLSQVPVTLTNPQSPNPSRSNVTVASVDGASVTSKTNCASNKLDVDEKLSALPQATVPTEVPLTETSADKPPSPNSSPKINI